MITFQEWLRTNHPEMLDEGLGKWGMLGAAGVLGAAGTLGVRMAGDAMFPQKAPKPQVQHVQQEVPPGMSKADAWKLRMSRKQAEKQKGTAKEIPQTAIEVPE